MNWRTITEQFTFIPDDPLLFHQGFFLFIFALFLLVYSAVANNQRLRQGLIILFSLFFYYKASGPFLLLLLATITADYLFTWWMERIINPRRRLAVLVFAISFSLSFLLYFKYRNFFIDNFALLTGIKVELLALILPIGISFYTFQSISYLVDHYQGKIKRPGYMDYLMYMLFFPHLVAGPIVRARDFLPQLKNKFELSKNQASEALYLITKGLVKKAIIADFVAQYADGVFSAPAGFSGPEIALASLAYTLQIFCDFSGYTDMAIGIALLLGYRLCLNFDSPYKAINITDFWRRWHISLSSWLRDYIYIPLGGNRKGVNLQLGFLMITMLIGGFWHGASWKFIFWGGAHGFLLIVHKLWMQYRGNTTTTILSKFFGWLLTFALVSLLWIPFRATDMESTWTMYTKIFSNFEWQPVIYVLQNNWALPVILLMGYLMTVLPHAIKEKGLQLHRSSGLAVQLLMIVFVIQWLLQMRSSVVQPFIYFQF
jgi:alginate O-acetyltransferase complex protein AlgI